MADENLLMEGRLIQLEREQEGLDVKIEGLRDSLRTMLNTALTSAEQMDMALITQQYRDLATSWGIFSTNNVEIKKLQKRLGRG